MKIKRYVQLSLVPVLLSSPLPLFAGNIDSSAPPGSTSSYTIADVCDRLDSGADGNQIIFTEPTAGPGSTGCTLNDVMSKAPAADNTAGALISEVLLGKTFFGLRTDGTWGLQTGTLATQTPDNTTVNQPAGNYSAFDLSAVDTDLATANIKSGVTIFGVIGTYPLAAVAKTGQTSSYATGDDGNLQKGATTGTRFTASNGTVTDNLTGLIWLENANCFGTKDWTTALSDANALSDGSCGLSDGSVAGDWRLPNVLELQTLIDWSMTTPALPTGHPFTGAPNAEYWSSTTTVDDTDQAWYMSIDTGEIYYADKTETGINFVWPVRGGQ